jgi:hypothetical protein
VQSRTPQCGKTTTGKIKPHFISFLVLKGEAEISSGAILMVDTGSRSLDTLDTVMYPGQF